MTLDALAAFEIIAVMESYIERNRPAPEIRSKLDYDYRIDKQSVYVFAIRPDWRDPKIIRNFDFAKTTFVQSKKVWKIYWLRSDLKWYSYDAHPEVKRLEDFIKIIEADEHGCFLG